METTVLVILILGAFAGWLIARLQDARVQQEALVDIGFGMVAAGIAGIVVIGLRIAGISGFFLYSLLLSLVGILFLLAVMLRANGKLFSQEGSVGTNWSRILSRFLHIPQSILKINL